MGRRRDGASSSASAQLKEREERNGGRKVGSHFATLSTKQALFSPPPLSPSLCVSTENYTHTHSGRKRRERGACLIGSSDLEVHTQLPDGEREQRCPEREKNCFAFFGRGNRMFPTYTMMLFFFSTVQAS